MTKDAGESAREALAAVAAGESISDEQRAAVGALLEGDKGPVKRDGKFKRRWAEYWGVSPRTVQRWERESVPYDSPERMERWAAGRKNVPGSVRRKLYALRQGDTTAAEKPAAESEADRAEADAKLKELIESKRGEDGLVELEGLRDVFNARLQDAIAAGNQMDIKFYSAQHHAAEVAIRQNKLAALKLGIDSEDLYSREAIERMVWALAFRLNAGVKGWIHKYGSELVGCASLVEVNAVLENALLGEVLVEPFRSAQFQASGIKLPPWIIKTITDAVDDFVEIADGRSIKEELNHDMEPTSPDGGADR